MNVAEMLLDCCAVSFCNTAERSIFLGNKNQIRCINPTELDFRAKIINLLYNSGSDNFLPIILDETTDS
jgi:hypothetical protein